MSNPLVVAKQLLGADAARYNIATIISKAEDKLLATTESGATITVWGTANVGNTVIVKDDQILGQVTSESTLTAYVA